MLTNEHRKEDNFAEQSRRIDYIDVAKALGIIAVMLSHGCGFPFGVGYFFTASYMALFFCLSGFTYKTGKSVGQNIKNRWKQIGGVYLLYSMVLFVLSLSAKAVLHDEISGGYVSNALERV